MTKNCYTCVARRVRCGGYDEADPDSRCENCSRLGEMCRKIKPEQVTRGSEYTQAGTKRKRVSRSCVHCRQVKRKCDGQQPCSRCASSRRHCMYLTDSGLSDTYFLTGPSVVATLADLGSGSRLGGLDQESVQQSVQQSVPEPAGPVQRTEAIGGTIPVQGQTGQSAQSTESTQLPQLPPPPPPPPRLDQGQTGQLQTAQTQTAQTQTIRAQIDLFVQPQQPGQRRESGHLRTGPDPGLKPPRPLSLLDRGDAYETALAEHGCRKCPEPRLMVSLVERYFDRMANSKLLGFLHRPSFMMQLEERCYGSGKDELMLLLALCSAAGSLDASGEPKMWKGSVGWAKEAFRLLTLTLNEVTVNRVMAIVFLYDHEQRHGNYSASFMLTSLAVRYTQLLQLNSEVEADIMAANRLDHVQRESRRRLFWAVYLMDSILATGVRQLKMISEQDIRIQLPMSNENFLFGRATKTAMLDDDLAQNTAVDHNAHFIQLVQLRDKVLTYVKQFYTDKPLWDPDSDFQALLEALATWRQSLPADLAFNSAVVYVRKDQNMLSMLSVMHIAYHQCYVDLYRILVPGLAYGMDRHVATVLRDAPPEFLGTHQKACFDHACELSAVFETMVKYETELIDCIFSVSAHESTRAMVLYCVNLENVGKTAPVISSRLHTNVRFLSKLAQRWPIVRECLDRTEIFVKKLGSSLEPHPGPPTDDANLDSMLNPLSQFRAIRDTVPDRHDANSALALLRAEPADRSNGMLSQSLESWLMSNNIGGL